MPNTNIADALIIRLNMQKQINSDNIKSLIIKKNKLIKANYNINLMIDELNSMVGLSNETLQSLLIDPEFKIILGEELGDGIE